jgi:2-polyprenyl-3-methyl-5-hydroxy-6-metoxy-1,4-benzoquinol methylase
VSRLASVYDFEPGEHRLRATAARWNPPMYDQYRRYPYFGQRADWIAEHYPRVKRVLVAGCGWGFLVEELVRRGIDAWGIDAADYAIQKAARHVRGVAPRIRRGDVLNAGIDGTYDLIVTEDLLPCASDESEAVRMAAHVRQHAGKVLHIVTPGDPADPSKLPGVLWKSLEEWKSLVGGDTVLSAESWEVL